jgi:hypothetical protein
MSTPGTLFISGCPCRLLSIFLNVFRLSLSKNPLFAKQLYNAGEQCPFDKTSLSLSSHFGFSGFMFSSLKYNTVNISAIESEPPGCPEPSRIYFFYYTFSNFFSFIF